jgi:hypothetical protein
MKCKEDIMGNDRADSKAPDNLFLWAVWTKSQGDAYAQRKRM